MHRKLPPLNQLRAFEAAARHESFRKAAEELHVTHAAVSHQVKALEDILGAQLFNRVTRGVTLTDEARELADQLTDALDMMDSAVGVFDAIVGTRRIKLSTVPWYANRILLPALDDFHAENPGIKIKLDFSYGLADFETDAVDAALRHGLGNWGGLISKCVHRDLLSPVSAPSLVKEMNLPLKPEQIADLTLGVARGYESVWHEWFEKAGWVPGKPLKFVEFENRALATEFAIAGHGVGMPNITTVGDEFQSGQLTLLHPTVLKPATGAYLVYPKSRQHDTRFGLIADWLSRLFAELPVPGGF